MDRETIRTYNATADQYDQETAPFWDKFPVGIFREFQARVSKGIVLDMGSGSGRDGQIITGGGIKIVCLDASTTMTRITQKKGLPTVQADLLDPPFKDSSFAGIWAYTSLLHIPKDLFPDSLHQIWQLLEEEGILGLGLIEGSGEGRVADPDTELPRYFAYYSISEIIYHLKAAGLKPFYFERFQPKKRNYLNFLAKKI